MTGSSQGLSTQQWSDGLWYVMRGVYEVAGPFETKAKAERWIRLI